MSIEAELGQYILQTQFLKKSEDSMGGLNPPLGTPVENKAVHCIP